MSGPEYNPEDDFPSDKEGYENFLREDAWRIAFGERQYSHEEYETAKAWFIMGWNSAKGIT